MHTDIVNSLLVKLGKEKKRVSEFWPNMIGGTISAGIGTAVTMPISNVADRIGTQKKIVDATGKILQDAYNPTFREAMRDMITEAKRPEVWKKGLSIKTLKNALQLGVALGAGNLIAHKLRNKTAHIASDLKIPMPPMKAKVEREPQRWTPIGPEQRMVWSKLTPTQKKTINLLFSEMPERVVHHNKDQVTAQLVKGRTFKQITDKIVQKLNKDPKIIL
jgi:hypothetical protein